MVVVKLVCRYAEAWSVDAFDDALPLIPAFGARATLLQALAPAGAHRCLFTPHHHKLRRAFRSSVLNSPFQLGIRVCRWHAVIGWMDDNQPKY